MNTPSSLEQVRERIARAEIEEAIDMLKVFFDGTPKLKKLLLQSANYHQTMNLIMEGTIEEDKARVSINQITKSLIALMDEVDEKKEDPQFQEEIAKSISITNSKNVVVGSQFTVEGNIHVGDQVTQTESKTSRYIRIFLFVLVPVLALGGAYWWSISQPFDLKVLIENQTPNPYLTDSTGTLILTYGGKLEVKNNIRHEAIFEEIPAKYRSEKLRLQYKARGFVEVDTVFPFTESILIPIYRNDELAVLAGYVSDFVDATDFLSDVIVCIDGCCCDTTDQTGRFHIDIPFDKQKPKQRIKIIKEGYQSRDYTETINKGDPIQTYLKKK
ncbi:MAG: hypothetical protein AAFU33_28270 [Bacteroidota bacterium]